MCTPIGLGIASIVLSTAQKVSQQQQEKASRQYQQSVDEHNIQDLAYQIKKKEYDIKQAQYDADLAKRKADRETAARASSLRLLNGSSGVDMSSGSALDVLLDNRAMGRDTERDIDRHFFRQQNELVYDKNRLSANRNFLMGQSKRKQTFLQSTLPYADMGYSALQKGYSIKGGGQ